jgi:hypothetical protein
VGDRHANFQGVDFVAKAREVTTTKAPPKEHRDTTKWIVPLLMGWLAVGAILVLAPQVVALTNNAGCTNNCEPAPAAAQFAQALPPELWWLLAAVPLVLLAALLYQYFTTEPVPVERTVTRASRIWGKPVDLTGEPRVVLTTVERNPKTKRMELTGIKLEHANLRGCKLGGTAKVEKPVTPTDGKNPPKQTGRPGADLRKAQMTGANFASLPGEGGTTSLYRANLEGAILTEANFENADLRHANFARAVLAGATLVGAKLDGTNFAWADLTGVITDEGALKNANVFGAKLTHAAIGNLHPRWLIFGRSLSSRLLLTGVG